MPDISQKFNDGEDKFEFPLSNTIGGTLTSAFGIEILILAYISDIAGNDLKQFGFGAGAALFSMGGYILHQNLAHYFRNRAILRACNAKFGNNERSVGIALRYIRSGPLLGYKEQNKA